MQESSVLKKWYSTLRDLFKPDFSSFGPELCRFSWGTKIKPALFWVMAISHQLNGVVDFQVLVVFAAIKNSSSVLAQLGSGHCHGQRPPGGQVVKYGRLIVGGEGLVTSQSQDSLLAQILEVAALG